MHEIVQAHVMNRAVLLPLFICVAANPSFGQNASQQYKAAEAELRTHVSQYEILNDDSTQAYASLQKVWSAAGAAVIEILEANPKSTPGQIDKELCTQGIPAGGCNPDFSPQHDIIQLGSALYAVAIATENGGTVLVIGNENGHFAQLWSLANASVDHRRDPHDLIGAWHADRTGAACREKGSLHKPGSCGPLYSELGLLPPDDKGRPRFYIDAGYEQTLGATIGKQTSIWRWDGDRAELSWLTFYDFMIDQSLGTSFDDDKGILHIGEKGEFRTIYSCGACIDRPLDQGVLITKSGIEDLGVRSLAPELDRIDDVFWRLQSGQSTVGVASSQVANFLRAGISGAKQSSKTIDPNWFTVGMIDSSNVTLTSTGAKVCIEPDSELGALYFKLRRTIDGGYFIVHAENAPKNAECERGAFLPLPQTTPPTP